MELSRLEEILTDMSVIYSTLAEEICRLRQMETAQNDSFHRFEQRVHEVINEKNKTIEELKDIINNGRSPWSIY